MNVRECLAKKDMILKMNFPADKRLLVIFRRLHLPSQLSCTNLISPPPSPPFPPGGRQFFFSVSPRSECVWTYTLVMKTMSAVCAVPCT